jgi:hypothetical protein
MQEAELGKMVVLGQPHHKGKKLDVAPVIPVTGEV